MHDTGRIAWMQESSRLGITRKGSPVPLRLCTKPEGKMRAKGALLSAQDYGVHRILDGLHRILEGIHSIFEGLHRILKGAYRM